MNNTGSTYYEHLRFYKAIHEGHKPEVSVLDGLWTVAVGAAAEESIRTRMPVEIGNLPKTIL